MEDGTKFCPFCAEKIQAAAVVCRFCNRELGSALPEVAPAESAPVTTPIVTNSSDNLGQENAWHSAAPLPELTGAVATPVSNQKIRTSNWKSVTRDVGIIWALTCVGGFIVGLSAGSVGAKANPAVIGFVNCLGMFVGFCISGCLVPVKRFHHLWIVALFSWITSLLNVFLGIVNFSQWLAIPFFICPLMGLGGLLSFAFVKAPKSTG